MQGDDISTVVDAVDVRGSIEDCLAVITDYEDYPRWEKHTRKAEIVERDQQGRGLRVSMVRWTPVKLVPFVLRYDYWGLPKVLRFERESGDVKVWRGSFTFDPIDGGTRLTYEMAVHPGFPIPDLIRRQIQRQHARGVVRYVKTAVESR